MTMIEKQRELDVSKWLQSEQAQQDLCGKFDFCAYCNKEIENPCAEAVTAMEAAKAQKKEEVKVVAQEVPAEAAATVAEEAVAEAKPKRGRKPKAESAEGEAAPKKTTTRKKKSAE